MVNPARIARFTVLVVPFFFAFEFKLLLALRDRLGFLSSSIPEHFDVLRLSVICAAGLFVLARSKDYLGDLRFFREEFSKLFAPSGAGETRPKSRDSFYDNAKFFLVVTVIMNHSIESFTRDSVLFEWLSIYINLITMPMFALLSGRFSRAGITTQSLSKIFWRLLAPYMIFQLILIFVEQYWFPEKKMLLTFMLPRLALWYLVSLALWRVLLPFFAGLKYPLALSVLLALLVGFDPKIEKMLSLSRTLAFFPFFLAGYYLKGDFPRLIKKGALLPLYSFFVLAFALVAHHNGINFRYWVFHSTTYFSSKLAGPLWAAPFLQAFILASSFILGLAVLALMPSKMSIFSRWGVNSMYPYLLHLPVVLYVRTHRQIFRPYLDSLGGQLVLILIVIVVGVLLSTKQTRFLFRPLVEPGSVVDWVRKRKAQWVAKKATD